MPTAAVAPKEQVDEIRLGDVTIEVTLTAKTPDIAPYLDIDLRPLPDEITELSISADIRNYGGGQCQDEIRKRFPEDADVQRLCDLWDAYHLNGTSAGTREQNEALKDMPAYKYPENHYDAAVKHLKAKGLYEVPIPEDVHGRFAYRRDGKTGELPRMYTYGSAWLFRHVPDEALAELRGILDRLAARKDEFRPTVKNSAEFAAEHGITMTTRRTERNPCMSGKMDPGARHWLCTLKARDGSRMKVYFSQGSGIAENPTVERVLDCLADDAAGIENANGFEEWASDLGFDADSRTAEKAYKLCEKQAEDLKGLLGDAYRELLFKVARS